MRRPIHPLPPDRYPPEPWALSEIGFDGDHVAVTETLFSLSNGYLGVRASLPDGRNLRRPGTFLNGFHETWPIVHPEEAYGFATTGQTIVRAPDATVVEIEVDGEPLDARVAATWQRHLDFRRGVLTHRGRWITSTGVDVDLRLDRLVSVVEKTVLAQRLTVTLDRAAQVTLRSQLVNRQDERQVEPDSESFDPRLGKQFSRRVLEPGETVRKPDRLVQTWTTHRSRQRLAVGLRWVCDPSLDAELAGSPDRHVIAFGGRFGPDRPLTLTLTASYQWSPDEDADLVPAVHDTLDRVGFDDLVAGQEKALTEFWDRADVEVAGDPQSCQALRWAVYQLHQASACVDTTGIPAKGLTSQAYDGHYFWDIEIYLAPFLRRVRPDVARHLLEFRYRMLDAARARASELSQRGALYPWRTISGEEASAYFEAGTAQYHIDAAVAYALRAYIESTGDDSILAAGGAEVLVETARLWHDLGFEKAGRFHIHGVTGPDEYTALVDDNAYTNLMARMNLRYAAEVVTRLADDEPEAYAHLVEATGLDPEEVTAWRLAADTMYVPYEPELGITPQHDTFLEQEPWDFEHTPDDMYPLLLHFHPLVIYRHQVIKQTDVVLAMFLLGDEFDRELRRNNFEYYDPITTGDSSLSACIQSIMAAETGQDDLAWEYFRQSAFMDLCDVAGNTADGVHLAAVGGTWMALVHGFAGLRDHGGVLRFRPRLPADWESVRFRMQHRGSHLEVKVLSDQVELTLLGGPPLEVEVNDQRVQVGSDRPRRIPVG